ncbi:hypothetical protein Tco_0080264 [Tanacetum coccineum]
MVNLEFSDKHNMVVYLEKSKGSEGSHKIIDFLNASHIKYALIKNSTIYVSFIKQFWRTAIANTRTDGEVELTAIINGHVKIVTEASLRRHMKLEDNDGITSLPNSVIFEQLALMGYHTNSDKLTFQKDRIEVLEKDLQQTKKTYSTAFTKLIFRVKKLEKQVKSGKAMKMVMIVLSEDEEAVEDSSKQGKKIAQIDEDPNISLMQDEGTLWFQEDEEVHEKTSANTEVLLEEETPTKPAEDVGSGRKGEKEVNTADVPVSTDGAEVSTASIDVSTAATALVYIRRSAETKKDKGKAIMIEYEPPKKINKKDQEQQEISDFETALELEKQLDKREVVSKAQEIDWNDPSVLRYHALKNKPVFFTQARKNMITFLKNQGGYKLSDYKKMSYDDIRPIFKKVWDQVQSFVPMDTEDKEKGKEKKSGESKKELAKKQVEEEIVQQEDIVAEQVELESSKKVRGSRRKTLSRKRAGEKKSADSVKRQKLQEAEVYEKEKEEFRLSLKLIPIDDSELEAEEESTMALELIKFIKSLLEEERKVNTAEDLRLPEEDYLKIKTCEKIYMDEDANLKLLRSLPSAWNNTALIMRNKSNLDTLSMDDLYNNFKVYEAKIKGQSSSSSNSQNVTFVSSENISSTNEAVNTAHDVSTTSSLGQASSSTYVDDVMFSFFAN